LALLHQACASSAASGDPTGSHGDVEAMSLFGEPLHRAPLAGAAAAEQERLREEAARRAAAVPDDEEALVWLGRRTAYLGRFREAIAIYGRGLERHPGSVRLLRHRGHRLISVRQFSAALADLERANGLLAGRPDEVEPDGMPNARNVPTSTLHGNVRYHLGLARYLLGDFPGAAEAYRACLEGATTDDTRVAASYWLYLALRRGGDDAGARAVLAATAGELDVIENRAYLELLRYFRAEVSRDELERSTAGAAAGNDPATVGYGLGAFAWCNGDLEGAAATWRQVRRGKSWAAFGHIAAEADLQRGGFR
jgi:tetratricopeptide (TPR) repeat protein